MHAPAANSPIDERALSKLRWRCRRGLLENDLFIERFFNRYATQLTTGQAEALGELMDLSDNDLLDLLLGRKFEVQDVVLSDACHEVLALLRTTH
ncbi:MAG: succinate dehydrogenase assembly factor 2 [Betaproteobacteria bacterium]|jgi:antitoxin CptB|nr:succinate dehydrogenase assembly factor 2 [Betaproteobacteria bacterium]